MIPISINSSFCKNGACYATRECNAIKHEKDTKFHNKVIIVFVGSGFTSSHDDWMTTLNQTFSGFAHFPFFSWDNEKIKIFYVDRLEESFCDFNCDGIDRLLCCNLKHTKRLSQKCFPSESNVQTVVIHNDNRYGGAGYLSSNVATTTTHDKGHLVAVHELGHSLFELGDEYISGTGDIKNPNCDNKGCEKWQQWINLAQNSNNGEFESIGCFKNSCKGGVFFSASPSSFMKSLDSPVGEMNLLYSCCTFLVLTNNFPTYCNKYGDGLFDFCQNDYQGYGGPTVYSSKLHRRQQYNVTQSYPSDDHPHCPPQDFSGYYPKKIS